MTNSTTSIPTTPYATNPVQFDDSRSNSTTAPVKEQIQTVGEEIKELGRRGKEAAVEEFGAVRERGELAVDQAKDRFSEMENTLSRSVQQKPLHSLMYAAGAGLVLGFMLRR